MPSGASASSRRGPPAISSHILTQLWADQGGDVDGNALVANLIREKIRAVVKDPDARRSADARTIIRSAPSVPASIPATTPPSIVPTSRW